MLPGFSVTLFFTTEGGAIGKKTACFIGCALQEVILHKQLAITDQRL